MEKKRKPTITRPALADKNSTIFSVLASTSTSTHPENDSSSLHHMAQIGLVSDNRELLELFAAGIRKFQNTFIYEAAGGKKNEGIVTRLLVRISERPFSTPPKYT